MREESGRLSRSNQRKLKGYKKSLIQRLGASVIYPEDRLHIPSKLHPQLAYELGKANSRIKVSLGEVNDGKLFKLIFDIFEFEVSCGTIKRYYYMSEDGWEFGI